MRRKFLIIVAMAMLCTACGADETPQSTNAQIVSEKEVSKTQETEQIAEYTVDEFNEIFRKIYEEWKKEASYYTEQEEEKKTQLLAEISSKNGLEVGERMRIRGILNFLFSDNFKLVSSNYDFLDSQEDEIGYRVGFRDSSPCFLLLDDEEDIPIFVEATYDPVIKKTVDRDKMDVSAFTDADLLSPSIESFEFKNSVENFVNGKIDRKKISGIVKEIQDGEKLGPLCTVTSQDGQTDFSFSLISSDQAFPKIGDQVTFWIYSYNDISPMWYIWN